MRKVNEVSFHQTVFVRGIGQLDKTLSATSPAVGAKSIKYDMSTDGNIVSLKLQYLGGNFEVWVPCANAIFMLLAPEDEKPIEKITLKTK